MNDELAHAIRHLTEELSEWREERRRELVTKADLHASERRIIASISAADPAALARLASELKDSASPLKAAIEANK